MAIYSIQTTDTILTKFELNMYYGIGQHTGYVHTIILNITPYFGHSTTQNQFLFFTKTALAIMIRFVTKVGQLTAPLQLKSC